MNVLRILVLIALAKDCPNGARAQDERPTTFEVATIRESDPGKPSRPSVNFVSNRLVIRSTTLKDLMTLAYDLPYGIEDQVIGGPSWIRTERFDIAAKEDDDASKRLRALPASEQGAANRLLIRELLAERFGMKVHLEPRVLSAYTLEIAKGGPKLAPGAVDPRLSPDIPQERVNVRGAGSLEAHNTDMALFVKVLGSQSELDSHSVVDRTGLKGRYDFTLRWTPAVAHDPQSFESQSVLFDALEEQLGLRVVSKKTSVSVLLVDEVTKPSANNPHPFR